MSSKIHQALYFACSKILMKMAKILLRHGVPHGTFSDWSKKAYIKVAEKEFRIPGRKISHSRIATLTGIPRHVVKKNLLEPDDFNQKSMDRYNRPSRVISGWVRDPYFANDEGEPADIPFEGGKINFKGLIKKYSGDIPPRSILDELVRVKAVKILKNQNIKLLNRAYVPQSGEIDKIEVLGVDVADLIATIDHNTQTPKKHGYLQLKVSSDTLDVAIKPKLKKLVKDKGLLFLQDMDGWLTANDGEDNTKTKKFRGGIGIYYFEENVDE